MKNKIGKSQFKYLDYLFEGVYLVKSKFYPDSTFFKKNDKVILELEKSGTLWVLYSVWTDISNMFSLDYSETQQLIKAWMEQQLKQEVVAPKKLTLYAAQYMGKKIKSEEVEPLRASSMYGLRIAMVEEKLKSEEVEPSVGGKLYVSALMEEQLKSAEVTPLDAGSNYLPFMEKQLKQEEITPKEAIPPQSWRDLEKEEITPRSAIAPPFRWRNLDSVKYVEIKPNVPLSTYHLKAVEEQLKSEEITPRQVVSASFDWIQEQINLEEVTPTSFFVTK
jgi:hypothetical protein